MSAVLAALDAALQDNVSLMGTLLEQQQYDEALQCMDERLALIDSLVRLAKAEPAQRSIRRLLPVSWSLVFLRHWLNLSAS